MPGPDAFHLNYAEVPLVAPGETDHPAFFVRDITGFSLPVQALSGMASEHIGRLYTETIINRIFASHGGSRQENEDSFSLADPGNGEPEGGQLRIVRFSPEAGTTVSPEQAAEIGSMAVDIIDGLIAVEEEDLRKNPTPLSLYARSVAHYALPEEYVHAYSGQQ